MTIAVNNGYAMAGNPDAARAFNARRQASAPQSQSVEEYRAAASRLAARFPDAVKMRVH